MQKWTYFSMGVMAALILLLGGALLMQGREPMAYAAPQGVDNQGQFIVATGSSEPNRYDMLWILHKHAPHPKLKLRGDEEGGILKGEQITLCLYKVERQGEKMKLMAARDIAFDIEFQNLNQENPDAESVYENFKKIAAKNKK